MILNFQKVTNFILKIIALVLMTLDHIGVFLVGYASEQVFSNPMFMTGYVFRCIGRLAFPLFILLLVEAIRNTKNIKLYMLRIGIITTLVLIAQVIIYYLVDSGIESALSPLIDLSLCGVTLMLLKRKDKLSFLSIIPIAYIFLVTIIQCYEISGDVSVKWLPFYIRPGYSLLGLCLSLLFYYSYSFSKLWVKKYNVDQESIEKTPYYRSLTNIFMAASLVVVCILIYCLSLISINGKAIFDIYTSSVQTWCLFSAIIILMYNGKLGYHKKWFQYGNYLYFPVHIVIIFLIFFLIFK